MIKKICLILILLTTILNAFSKEEIIELYKNKEYRKVCLKTGDFYTKFKDDEDLLSMYANACLEVDMINRTILPIIKLHKSKESRENAAYFSTILYQKKLLYHALVDDVDISYVNLPKTKYILSIIFNKFVIGDYDLKGNEYWFKDDVNNELTYSLSVNLNKKTKKLFLKTYENNILKKIRTYW